jgi:hypothetical protein
MPFFRKRGGFGVNQQAPLGYYYGDEANQYTFYRLPKVLFTDDRYKGMSDGAKILYGLMLDRMALSAKNGWLDDRNRVFIYFTLEDVQEYMSCKHEKAVKLLAELDMDKGIGLIERVKRGQGKPTIIYVRKFVAGTETLTSENQKSRLPVSPNSRLPKNRSQDFRKSECSNTEDNNTELNETENPSIHPAQQPREQGRAMDRIDTIETYREIVNENISYDILCERQGRERVDEAVELILETLASQRPNLHIAGDEYPAAIVKSRLLKLDASHVEYVFGCLDANTTKIRNIKSYLLTALYNAPATMDSFYRAEVNHDLYGGG